MKCARTAPSSFLIDYESEEELREEYRVNISAAGLRLPGAEPVPLYSSHVVTLRGPWGGEATVRATAVAMLPEGVALAIEGDTAGLLEALLARATVEPPRPAAPAEAPEPPKDQESREARDRNQTAWDRIRGLSQMEKILLAVKSDRSERMLIVQDNDPRVLLSLLKNPRLTIDEVARVAKSSFLTYQVAEAITKTGHWMANLEVRLALVHNAKTPPQFALRILPTLPESEVRAIARSATNMALKHAAMKRLHGG